jgi:hypothetical protein
MLAKNPQREEGQHPSLSGILFLQNCFGGLYKVNPFVRFMHTFDDARPAIAGDRIRLAIHAAL